MKLRADDAKVVCSLRQLNSKLCDIVCPYNHNLLVLQGVAAIAMNSTDQELAKDIIVPAKLRFREQELVRWLQTPF